MDGVFMEKPIIPPFFALIIGVVAVSTSAIFVKLASSPAPIVATYRLVAAVLLMLPFVLFHKDSLLQVKQMTAKQWGLGILSGFFLASHFLLWFESLHYTSVASSTVLVSLQPLFSFIGGYLVYKERISGLGILGGIIAIGGCFIIGWGDFQFGGTALFGDFLALLGALTVTLYFLIGQHVRKSLSLRTYTFIVYAVSALFLLLYSVSASYPLTDFPASDWIWFLSLAVIPTFLGHSIFNWVIKWLSTTTISMSILGEAVGSSILAYFILGETITIPQWIGGSVILAGIYIFIRYNSHSKGAADHESNSKTPEQIA